MKIYMLLMLVGVFVGFSYLPIRDEAKPGRSGAARFFAGMLPKA